MLLKTSVEALSLRNLSMEDIDGFYAWQNVPEIARWYAFTRTPRSREEAGRALTAIVEGVERDSVHLAVVKDAFAAEEKFIGVVSLKHISFLDRHAEFAAVIGSPGQMGKGYGRAASVRMIRYGFEALNLRKVYMSAFADNERTIHLYESIGFKKEGVSREHIFRDGVYEDLVWLSLFREELVDCS